MELAVYIFVTLLVSQQCSYCNYEYMYAKMTDVAALCNQLTLHSVHCTKQFCRITLAEFSLLIQYYYNQMRYKQLALHT